MTIVLLFILFLVTKHFIIDFLWQPEYEWKNKGTWGHPGGIHHALKHALTTTAGLSFIRWYGGGVFLDDMTPGMIVCVGFVEFFGHYLIDYCKVNIVHYLGLDPKKHAAFWYLTGFDQYLHHLTYLWIIAYVIP